MGVVDMANNRRPSYNNNRRPSGGKGGFPKDSRVTTCVPKQIKYKESWRTRTNRSA